MNTPAQLSLSSERGSMGWLRVTVTVTITPSADTDLHSPAPLSAVGHSGAIVRRNSSSSSADRNL